MKNKLKIFSILAFFLTFNLTKANNLKVKEFNYSNKIDYSIEPEVLYNDNIKGNLYFFSTFNTNEILIAIKEKDSKELTPVLFSSSKDGKTLIKDVNNYLEVISIDYKDNKIKTFEIYDKNFSKDSYLKAGGCLGGSTSACFDIAKDACHSDPGCNAMCYFAGMFRCHGAMLAACAINCNLRSNSSVEMSNSLSE